ncbi:MAG: hypothetical protein KAT15_20970 [Bacteroidales bacterium]|nr:hypothetical protein [Bacteroidales bacterium]
MKTRYHIPITILLLLTPIILSAQQSVYTFPFENAYRLPAMQTFINTEDIANTYQTMGNIYTTEITGLGDEKMEQTSMTFISDAKVVDAIRFLEFYLEDHLLAPGDDPSGLVEMSIIYYHEYFRINVGTVLGVLTFGLGTLFGIPFATSITDVEVEASFFNEEEYLIGTHRGVGRGKKLQTLYNMSTRKAHQRAIKEALDNLNTSIMTDPDLPDVAAH